MTIFARPADTRSGPTLMGQVLPDLIRNRVRSGFYKKKKKPETQPETWYPEITKISHIYIYIYIYIYTYNNI